MLVQVTRESVKELGLNSFSYLDLCSGTGAIYLSLLLEFGDEISRSVGVDSSFRACQNTLENLYELGLLGSNKVILSSWHSFLEKQSQWEVITINPPYLAYEEWTQNLKHDPKNSLVASQKGLAHYQKFLYYLQKNTYWKLVVLECSEFHESYWKEIESLNTSWCLRRYKDYLGKFRVVSITRK
ncbi:class I SAM-dependent methyltransferase [Mycoplasma wenyonii]|uniref:class I SAM-dependent methyltransferase n=1 Tax=Mycoplasma wenyonii TaxID=65123 RepID=UPI0021ACF059|nr:class I SAM-dependent methyltransferase [Mycoplasma wenyonii]